MRRYVLFPLVFFLGVLNLSAQFNAPVQVLEQPVPPANLVLPATLPANSAAQRSGLTDALNEAFDSIANLSTIQGFTAAVTLNDGTVWKRAGGTNSGIPVITQLNTNHLMGMGSISKTFVAATLLLMEEDGLLDLDDSIGQYLGDYPNISEQATVRQLLSHRTGFNDYLNENPAMVNAWLADLDSIWEADTILYHYVLPPNFPLGTDWSYSNTNFLLAGKVIESVTGQPWYEVVRTRILIPQGLTHTFAYPWEVPVGQPIAHVWVDVDGNGSVDDVQGLDIPLTGFFSLANSAGCLLSTPEDIARFFERLYGGHILQPASLAAMQTDYVQNPALGFQYGLGTLQYMGFGLENWGHDGSLFYKSFSLYFPDYDIAIAVQQNDDRTAAANPQLVDLVDMLVNLLLTYIENAPSSGIDDPAGANRLWAAPNPACDQIRIQFPANTAWPVQCRLTDMQGRIVLQQSLEQPDAPLLLGGIPQGMYILSAGNASARIVVGEP